MDTDSVRILVQNWDVFRVVLFIKWEQRNFSGLRVHIKINEINRFLKIIKSFGQKRALKTI